MHYRLTVRSLLCAAVVLSAAGQVSVSAQDDVSATHDRASMVILAPNGPVFVDFRISVNGYPYRSWVSGFLATRLDLDKSGTLTAEEVDLIPDSLKSQLNLTDPEMVLGPAAGSEPGEHPDAVTRDQFTDWMAARLDRGFNVIAEAIQAAMAVRLAGHLDADADGAVSEQELHNAVHHLRFRDLDDDRTYSATELLPFRDPRTQQLALTPDTADLPFVQIDTAEAIERTTDLIVRRYGDGNSVPLEVLRLPPPGPGASPALTADPVTRGELTEFLRTPVFHLIADVLMADRSGLSRTKVMRTSHTVDFAKISPDSASRVNLEIDGMPIVLRSRGGSGRSRSMLVNFVLQRFSIADEDRNQYVDESEFAMLVQPLSEAQLPTEFTTLDRNQDGMLFRQELKAFIERDAIAGQTNIEVTVRQDGRTLFSLLDANIDRRLSPREFQEGFGRLAEWDSNGDGRLAETELGTEYHLQIGLGRPPAMRGAPTSMMGAMQNSTDARLPSEAAMSGPEWFRRMDRNQDGDVSRREFPGPAELFQQVDTDADGLISAEEADSVSTDV